MNIVSRKAVTTKKKEKKSQFPIFSSKNFYLMNDSLSEHFYSAQKFKNIGIQISKSIILYTGNEMTNHLSQTESSFWVRQVRIRIQDCLRPSSSIVPELCGRFGWVRWGLIMTG